MELTVEFGVAEATFGDVPFEDGKDGKDGKEGTVRSTSLVVRNRSLSSLNMLTAVKAISLVVATPSRTVTRFLVVSSRRISSKKGAYPASWDTPRRI